VAAGAPAGAADGAGRVGDYRSSASQMFPRDSVTL